MTRYVVRDICIIFEYIYKCIYLRGKETLIKDEGRNELFPSESTFPFNYDRQKINIYSRF